MEKFNAQIKGARTTIASKPYDPLDYRIEIFNKDFEVFVKEVEQAEVGMQQFVKQQIADVPIAESVILILQRFERLGLECLCLDRRYLEVAEMLEKEMFLLKDVYVFALPFSFSRSLSVSFITQLYTICIMIFVLVTTRSVVVRSLHAICHQSPVASLGFFPYSKRLTNP